MVNPLLNSSTDSSESNRRNRNSVTIYDLTGSNFNPSQYSLCLKLQRDLRKQQMDIPHSVSTQSKPPHILIVTEHLPVYTLGTGSTLNHVKFNLDEPAPCNASLIRTERGGEVTFHGPGQLVLYPILRLAEFKKDIRWYIQSLENVVIRVLQDSFQLDAHLKPGLIGVWVGNAKVCAIGLHISRWVSMHGIALNVDIDLKPFEYIIPCGISDRRVSSIHELLLERGIPYKDLPTMDHVKQLLLTSFQQQFSIKFENPTSQQTQFLHGQLAPENTPTETAFLEL